MSTRTTQPVYSHHGATAEKAGTAHCTHERCVFIVLYLQVPPPGSGRFIDKAFVLLYNSNDFELKLHQNRS